MSSTNQQNSLAKAFQQSQIQDGLRPLLLDLSENLRNLVSSSLSIENQLAQLEVLLREPQSKAELI